MNRCGHIVRAFQLACVSALFTAFFFIPGCQVPPKEPEEPPSPYVQVWEIDGKWWFVQHGVPFIAKGISVVLPEYDSRVPDGERYNIRPKYNNDLGAWTKDVEARFEQWNFNTIAAWSDPYLYKNANLHHTRMITFLPWGTHGEDRLYDVFSEEFAAGIDDVARKEVAPHAEDPYLIGYFAGNELPWYGEWGWPDDPRVSLLSRYMRLDGPSKDRVVTFVREFYDDDFAEFTKHWETGATSFDGLYKAGRMTPKTGEAKKAVIIWSGIVADKYYSLCRDAIKRYDQNHLVLGSRIAGRAPTPVMAACGKYCDVISLNRYRKTGEFDEQFMGAVAALTDKPIMITEFSWRAMENRSGCKNVRGADVTVDTQQDRANNFRKYITKALEQPYIVGFDWFQYADQSPQGRFDGENSNYGIVDNYDKPYEQLVAAMTEINARAEGIHRTSSARVPAYDPTILSEYRPVSILGSDTPLRAPITWGTGSSPVTTYGDHVKDGRIEVGDPGNTRVFKVNTGTGWGCGASTQPASPTHPDGSANVLGAQRILIRMRLSRPVPFGLSLNESGHGGVHAQTYDGHGSADGEAYNHLRVDGLEGWQEYTFLLGNFEHSVYHGNQRGNKRIDTDGLAEICIYFPGEKGEVEMELESIRLE